MTTGDRQSTFSGTREVAERLRFAVGRLETWLRDHVTGFAGPVTLSQFKGGQSNPTYLVETPARRYVLRRKPPGKLLPSAPESSFVHLGAGTNMIYVDAENDLMVVARWIERGAMDGLVQRTLAAVR